MALGLFKKKQEADLAFVNGTILTGDYDISVSAVAIAGDKILKVGDDSEIEELIGKDTEVYDLEGKFVLPGFVNFFEHPVMEAFEGEYLNLKGLDTLEEIAKALKEWEKKLLEEKPEDVSEEEITVFAYGVKGELFLEEAEEKLDEIIADKPVVLLCENNIGCILNTFAKKIVDETAEEECLEVVTTEYILNLFIPFDFETIDEKVGNGIRKNLKKGYTSVLSTAAPDYFEMTYQDSLVKRYNEEALDLRFFGSFFANRPLAVQGLIYMLMNRKTYCLEIEDNAINKDLLYLEPETEGEFGFDVDKMTQMLIPVMEKGFGVYVKADTEEKLDMAYEALDNIRKAGPKGMFIIESPFEIDEDKESEMMYAEDAYLVLSKDELKEIETEDLIDELTNKAAVMLGLEDKLGKIAEGYYADLQIYSEDPRELEAEELMEKEPDMVIFAGKVFEEQKNL